MFNRKDFRVGLTIAALLHGGLLAYAVLAVRAHLQAGREGLPRNETCVVVTIAEAPPAVVAKVEPPAPVQTAPAPPEPPPPAAVVPPPTPPPEVAEVAVAPPAPVAEIAQPEMTAREAPLPAVAAPEAPEAIPVASVPQPVPFAGIPSFSAGELDIRPRYPIGARMRGEEGLVRLLVNVLPSGSADSVSVAESSGFPVLDRAAIDAVRNARFRKVTSPGGSSGKVLLSFRFQLVDARPSDSNSARTAP